MHLLRFVCYPISLTVLSPHTQQSVQLVQDHNKILVLRPKGSLCFTNATTFFDRLYAETVTAGDPPLAAIIDGSSLVDMDFSAILSLEETLERVVKSNIPVSRFRH